MKREAYTPPPEPVYKAGKRKERCSKAIGLVVLLQGDSLDPDLRIALEALLRHRKKLEE